MHRVPYHIYIAVLLILVLACSAAFDIGPTKTRFRLGWSLVEKNPCTWDWSIYDRNERVLHENGLQYNVFC